MWANAQRDGRPAKYRWCPLFKAAKFGWRSLLECRAVTLPRRETRWSYLGCPKLTKRSQPLVGRSSPYCEDMWRSYCCLTSLFPILSTCLICEDIAWQTCAMGPDGDFWRLFWVLHLQRAACSTFQTCILNSNFNCTWDLMLICWKIWSSEHEYCRSQNPHTSKISRLLPVCLTNNRRWCDHISEPHAKFGENQKRTVYIIIQRPICSQTHIQTYRQKKTD